MGTNAITLKQAAAYCGGSVAPQYASLCFRGAAFDTRRLEKGALFAALQGARDGHDFIPAAMEKGAAAVLAARPVSDEIPAIYVDDTELGLQQIAKGWRESLDLVCVGVTGSVGKTTTKEMIACVLESSLPTAKTAENFNNGIGLPVTVLGIGRDCRAAVLEMGMNHFGEISRLTAIAQPNIAVITNIGTMHIENLGSQEGILKAKLEILEGLRPEGVALFCGDDPRLREAAKNCNALCYGLQEHNEICALQVKQEPFGCTFTAVAFGEEFPVTLPVAGVHNVCNALAAIAVGLRCGVRKEKIQEALASFQNTGMRQKFYRKNGIGILEDCYNAGPESMEAALQVLKNTPATRRIAVLGGMLELGAFAPEAHFSVGQKAGALVDAMLVYGTNSQEYVKGARAAGLEQAFSYESHEALTEELKQILQPGDVLLVKGSRGMQMERILSGLFTKETEV